ncbi:MAG: hypothetical protein RR728_07250 [Oscillospiraceae bacterium]
MKRLLATTIALALTLSLTACGNDVTTQQPPTSQLPSSTQPSSTTPAEEPAPERPGSISQAVDKQKIYTLDDFEKHSGDSTHMKPTTEDFYLYQASNDVFDYNLLQEIHSFDEQGNCCSVHTKTVFKTEETAKKEYNERSKIAASSTVLDGIILYGNNQNGCGTAKSEHWKTFLEMQQLEPYVEGLTGEKLYFSKPITNSESSLPTDTTTPTSKSAVPPTSETSVSESQGNTASNDGNIYANKLKFAVDIAISEQDIKLLKATTDDYCTSVAVIDGLEELIITSFDQDGKVVNIDMRSECENADKTKECFDGTYYDYIDNSLKKAIDNYVYISGFKDGLNKSDYRNFAQSGENGSYYFSK